MINQNLDWEDHILKLCTTGRKLTAWILNVFYTRNKDVLLTLFNSLIRSRLEYCSQVWDPYQIKHIDAIEQVQRSFTRKIEFMGDLSYWDRLKKLNIMSLQRRREKNTLIFVWKIKNDHVPNEINLQFLYNQRKLKSQVVLKPMPKIRGKILSTYENSFVIKAGKLWNKLPATLTEIPELNLFRSKLDKYLSLIPDHPPVKGYYHCNKNSLLEYKTSNV